jgi:probable HAF family extracellular repeat protein
MTLRRLRISFTTQYGALWQNGVLTNLGTLPGDAAAIATGLNSKGQVVGNTWDSNFNWSHGFIWQNGVVTDLNTLFPASSNLYATMANEINERGQISGTVNQSTGRSVADVAPTRPISNFAANFFSIRRIAGKP